MYLPGMAGGDGRIHHSVLNRSKNKQLDTKRAASSCRVDDQSCKNAIVPRKNVSFDLPSIGAKSTLATDTITEQPDTKYISYYGNPLGPKMWFKRPKNNRKNNAAAIKLQAAARGMCARTNFYIRKLQHRLDQIQQAKRDEIRAIEADKKSQMLKLRRKLARRETKTLQQHLASTETASQGAHIIQGLRHQNKKLREKNKRIADSIAELRKHNGRLEKATETTGEGQSLLSHHYDKIKQTHFALQKVLPQYESRLRELEEMMDVRRQYCWTEHKTKVLYVKTVAALAEAIQSRTCNSDDDTTLVDTVMALCMEVQSEVTPENTTAVSTTDATESGAEVESEEEINDDDEDVYSDSYDEDEDSDSNDYDEYSVAVFERDE